MTAGFCIKHMNRIILSLAVILLASSLTAKTIEKPSFTDQLLQAVYRVVGADGDIATGFFVSCVSNSDTSSMLITARHVLDNIKSDSAMIFLRRQTDSGTFEHYQYTFPVRENGAPLFTVHPDSTVDIAALQLPLPAGFDARVIGQSILATADDFAGYDLKAGTDVNFLGYPEGMANDSSDYSLLRRGAISSHPIAAMKPFLIDGTIRRGNSGGPVYIDPGTSVIRGKLETRPPRLIGVVVNVRIKHEADGSVDYLSLGRVVSAPRILELLALLNCK